MTKSRMSFLNNDQNLIWSWFTVSLLALTAGNVMRVWLATENTTVRALLALGALFPPVMITLMVLVVTRMYHRIWNTPHANDGTDVVFLSPIALSMGLMFILGAVGFGHFLLLAGIPAMGAVFGATSAVFSLFGAITALVIAARPHIAAAPAEELPATESVAYTDTYMEQEFSVNAESNGHVNFASA